MQGLIFIVYIVTTVNYRFKSVQGFVGQDATCLIRGWMVAAPRGETVKS